MKLIVAGSYEEMSCAAARVLIATICGVGASD